MNKKVIVFTGAGVSADSGIATFRDAEGLWANHRIEDVCTPEALMRNREEVIRFYNMRRRELLEKEPNAGHHAIAELEKYFDVQVITQNIDDLHERAGSSKVLHLHGELRKLCSSADPSLTVPVRGWEQQLDERAPDGSLLRPFVVFFGEAVPNFDAAARLTAEADLLIVVGTSLAVYPAASLVGYAPPHAPIYLVDPGNPALGSLARRVTRIAKRSAEGMPQLLEMLIRTYSV